MAFIVQSTVSLTEVWYVGQLGSTPLAAMALVFPMLMLMQMLSVGALGNAVSSAIARALGAGDQARAEELMWHGLILAVLGPIVLLIAFLISGRFFLSLLGGTGEILELAFAYSAMLFGGGVTIWIMGVASSIFRGSGRHALPRPDDDCRLTNSSSAVGRLSAGIFWCSEARLICAAVSVIATSAVMAVIILLRLASAKLPANAAGALPTASAQLSRHWSRCTSSLTVTHINRHHHSGTDRSGRPVRRGGSCGLRDRLAN